MIEDIPCVILSGGKSSRMGEDKSLLPFGEFDTLIEYQYNKFSKIFKDVYISSKDNKFNFDANLILDDTTDISSPLIALQSIFKKINSKKVFIVTVDMPLLQNETIELLIEKSKNRRITICKDDNQIHYLCGVFETSMLENITSLIAQDIHKVRCLLDISQEHTIVTIKESKQLLNINERTAYNEALAISKTYSKY